MTKQKSSTLKSSKELSYPAMNLADIKSMIKMQSNPSKLSHSNTSQLEGVRSPIILKMSPESDSRTSSQLSMEEDDGQERIDKLIGEKNQRNSDASPDVAPLRSDI